MLYYADSLVNSHHFMYDHVNNRLYDPYAVAEAYQALKSLGNDFLEPSERN